MKSQNKKLNPKPNYYEQFLFFEDCYKRNHIRPRSIKAGYPALLCILLIMEIKKLPKLFSFRLPILKN